LPAILTEHGVSIWWKTDKPVLRTNQMTAAYHDHDADGDRQQNDSS